MKFAAVLFDLDGTLLNTLDDIAASANRVLVQHGYPPHPVDDYRFFVGQGVTQLITRILPTDQQNNATLIESCLTAFREDHVRNFQVMTRPYAGVVETLNELAGRGLKLAVLSNKPDEMTRQCVAAFFADLRFDIVMGQQVGIPHKPDPTGARLIAERLQIAPARFLYLGDSSIDMQTAIAAGMFPVGALWGFRPREELLNSGARALINRPGDLLHLLG